MNRFELLTSPRPRCTRWRRPATARRCSAREIPVAGRSAIATIKAYLANMLAGQYISEHDYLIGGKIADVMCGGDVEAGSLVDEQWFLDLERASSWNCSRPRRRRRASSTC